MRGFSRQTLGHTYRLEVAAGFAQLTPVSVRRLARALGLPDNVVWNEVQSLLRAGLIAPASTSGRERNYALHEHPYWSFASEVVSLYAQEGPTPTKARRRRARRRTRVTVGEHD